jgi:hypothetical protein
MTTLVLYIFYCIVFVVLILKKIEKIFLIVILKNIYLIRTDNINFRYISMNKE